MAKNNNIKHERESSAKVLPLPSRILYLLSENLIEKDIRWIASGLLDLLRFRRRHEVAGEGQVQPETPARPTGPFIKAPGSHDCALLNFVPRNYKSRLIDDATGGYGYSHTAIDAGEVDLPTGKRVMIESTLFDVVHRSFQDTYGKRPFVRIPLKKTGINCEQFTDCVKSKLGQQYDNKEALTWGRVDDPAKQTCSDLAADCLPDEIRQDIARKYKEGKFSHRAVSVHKRKDDQLGVWVSPNAFSEYFGAPRGVDISRPEQEHRPKEVGEVKTRHGLAGLGGLRLAGLVLAAFAAAVIWLSVKK